VPTLKRHSAPWYARREGTCMRCVSCAFANPVGMRSCGRCGGQTEPSLKTLRHRRMRFQDAELLDETLLFPDQVYTFTHGVTHELTYGSLLQAQRRLLHARVTASSLAQAIGAGASKRGLG
jgi:hypothetical protein